MENMVLRFIGGTYYPYAPYSNRFYFGRAFLSSVFLLCQDVGEIHHFWDGFLPANAWKP